MILRLGEALGLSLGRRNQLFQAAGFTAAFAERGWSDQAFEPARAPFCRDGRWVEACDPSPAYVLDRGWNVVFENRASRRPRGLLLEEAGSTTRPEPPFNLLRLLFDPAGLRPAIENWAAERPDDGAALI